MRQSSVHRAGLFAGLEHCSLPVPQQRRILLIASPVWQGGASIMLRTSVHLPRAGLRYYGDRLRLPASIPVSVLRAGSLHPADQGITLAAGDRVSLLIPAAQNSQPPDAEPPGRGQDYPAVHPRTDRLARCRRRRRW
jgi:hypothetical protein